jgi:hypothetical protein
VFILWLVHFRSNLDCTLFQKCLKCFSFQSSAPQISHNITHFFNLVTLYLKFKRSLLNFIVTLYRVEAVNSRPLLVHLMKCVLRSIRDDRSRRHCSCVRMFMVFLVPSMILFFWKDDSNNPALLVNCWTVFGYNACF